MRFTKSFQSTHPCGVRPVGGAGLQQPLEFQSTHPCGVRLIPFLDTLYSSGVSIHAPLRGATYVRINLYTNDTGFNPRTPAGCDS